MEEVRGGNTQNVPDVLKQHDLSRALYGALKEQITPKAGTSGEDAGSGLREDGPAYGGEAQRPAPPADEILAEAAASMPWCAGGRTSTRRTACETTSMISFSTCKRRRASH